MSEELTRSNRSRLSTWQDPLLGAKAATILSGMDYFGAMKRGELPVPPIMELINFQATEFEEGRIVFSFEPAEYHYNPIGSVHGGVISTLCDSAMGCAVHTTLPAGVAYTSLEIKVNFLKALTRDSGRVYCEGKIIQVGGASLPPKPA